MASISRIFKGKGRGKSKDEKKSHTSTSSQSKENGQQIGKDEEKSKVLLKQKSSGSEIQNSGRKQEQPTTSGASSGDGHGVVGPQTEPKSASTDSNLKHHVDREKDVITEGLSHEEYLPSSEYPPHHSNLTSQPMSLDHQGQQVSSWPEILEVEQAMQMVSAVSLGNQEHPGSPDVIPVGLSMPQLEEKVTNTSATVNSRHPGAPDEARANSYNSQGSSGTTDDMPQNSVGQLGVAGRHPLNHGAETSSSVDDPGLHDSRTCQASPPEVVHNHGDEASGNISDGVPSSNEGHCASAVAQPSSAVNQGSSDTTGPADVTGNMSHASQEQMPVVQATPANEQGSEASGSISLTSRPTQVSETEALTADEEEDAAIFHSQCLVTETIMKNKALLDKLTRSLDRTHRVIKGWEHLACTQVIKAPLETRLRCKLKAEHSPTEKLIDILSVVHGNTELRVFCEKLRAIGRMDVLEIVKEYFSDAENSTALISDSIASNDELIERMATKLDQKARIIKYWLHLGRAFNVSSDQLKEIEYRYNPTLALMEYIYTTSASKFTVKSFNDYMVTFKRNDVVQKLEPLMQENGGSAEMRVAIPLDSDLMRTICVSLNNPNNVLKNWKHLARVLGVDREIYEDFNPGDFKSPTALLFDWVFAVKTQLTVGELCCALKDIERYDLVATVREHLQ